MVLARARLPGVLCIFVLALSPRRAGAAEWDSPNPIAADWPTREAGRWYGYQTLLADAASLTIGAVAFSHRGDPYAGRFGSTALTLGLIAGAGYLLGPPGVHALHGRTSEAESSLTLRFGLPAAAALLSFGLYVVGSGGNCNACIYAIPVVGGAAVVTPIVIDALSRDRVEPRGFAFRF